MQVVFPWLRPPPQGCAIQWGIHMAHPTAARALVKDGGGNPAPFFNIKFTDNSILHTWRKEQPGTRPRQMQLFFVSGEDANNILFLGVLKNENVCIAIKTNKPIGIMITLTGMSYLVK